MPNVTLFAERLFSIGPWEVTNSLVGAVIAGAILVALAVYVSRHVSVVPGRIQSLLELPFEFMYGVVRDQGGRTWRSMLPLIAAIFIFLLVTNKFKVVPALVFAILAMLLYIPSGYYLDSFMYRRYQRKQLQKQ